VASTLRFSPINEQRTTLAFVAFVLLWGLTFGTALAGAPSTSDAVEKGAAQSQGPPGSDEQDQAPPSSSEDENLTEQLDRNKGVITPPATGDTDIYTEPPNPNPGTTPVIPPPGTPGGDQSVEPK
jgi:hypothetical protein